MGLGIRAVWFLCTPVTWDQGQVTQGFSVQVGSCCRTPLRLLKPGQALGTPELVGWSAPWNPGALCPCQWLQGLVGKIKCPSSVTLWDRSFPSPTVDKLGMEPSHELLGKIISETKPH